VMKTSLAEKKHIDILMNKDGLIKVSV
jgi:hypothetical protein